MGFAGERTGNMASCDPEHVQAAKWWLISGVFACVLEGSSIQYQAAAAHRSRLWGEAAAVRLCSLARIRFSAALSNNNAEKITPFSSLNYPRECPGFKRKGKKRAGAEVCSRPGCSALRLGRRQACGDGRGLPGSIKFAPNRRGMGWRVILTQADGGKRRCHFS